MFVTWVCLCCTGSGVWDEPITHAEESCRFCVCLYECVCEWECVCVCVSGSVCVCVCMSV